MDERKVGRPLDNWINVPAFAGNNNLLYDVVGIFLGTNNDNKQGYGV